MGEGGGWGGGVKKTQRQKGGGHCFLFLGRELLIEPPLSSDLVLQLYVFLQS